MLVKASRENFWMLNWLDEYMIGHKGFICGGCFKNIFSKEKVKDLDIFFEKEWGKNPAPCHITMAGFRELPSEPDLHLSAYPALQMSV